MGHMIDTERPLILIITNEFYLHTVCILDKKMNETKKNSNTIGIDRIAIMTALNLASDLLEKNTQVDEITSERNELSNQLKNQNNMIHSVSDKIVNAIGKFEERNLP